MKTLSIVFATLLFSQLSFANERGNGGDAVVCRDNNGSIIKAELLDYYEGRALRKIPNVLADSADPEFLRELTDKLTTYEPLVFESFKYEARLMLTAFLNYRGSDIKTPGYVFVDREIEDIQDSMELLMPRGCRVEQLVIRAVKKFPEDPSFIVQGEILKALSEKDVMGIVVHELIYGAFAIKLGSTDSRAARLFHQRLMSQKIDVFTFETYAKHTAEIRSNIYREKYQILLEPWLGGLVETKPTPLPDGNLKMFTSLGFQGIFDPKGELNFDLSRKGGSTWLRTMIVQAQFPASSSRKEKLCREKFGEYSGTVTIKNPLGIEKSAKIQPVRNNDLNWEYLTLTNSYLIFPFSGLTEVVIDFPAPKTFDPKCFPQIELNFIIGNGSPYSGDYGIYKDAKYVDTVKISPQGYQAKKKLAFGLNEKLELEMTQH